MPVCKLQNNELSYSYQHQDGRVVKALDLSSNGRFVRVGSNRSPAIPFFPCFSVCLSFLHILNQTSEVGEINFLISLLYFLVAN